MPRLAHQAERELASGRVSHNHDSFPINLFARRMLHQKLVGRANIGERSGPASAGVADAPVFQVRRGQSTGGEGRAQMPGIGQTGGRRATMYIIERLSLTSPSGPVVLDTAMMGSGRLIVDNIWRRLAAVPAPA